MRTSVRKSQELKEADFSGETISRFGLCECCRRSPSNPASEIIFQKEFDVVQISRTVSTGKSLESDFR